MMLYFRPDTKMLNFFLKSQQYPIPKSQFNGLIKNFLRLKKSPHKIVINFFVNMNTCAHVT